MWAKDIAIPHSSRSGGALEKRPATTPCSPEKIAFGSIVGRDFSRPIAKPERQDSRRVRGHDHGGTFRAEPDCLTKDKEAAMAKGAR
jgi:hypothetical protein